MQIPEISKVETAIKSDVAAEEFKAKSWFASNKAAIVAVAVAFMLGAILAKLL